MRIQRHRNGTFSLTDLSREDLDNLTMGATTAIAFYAKGTNGTFNDDWDGRNVLVFQRLEAILRRVKDTRSTVNVNLISAGNGRLVNEPDHLGRRSYEQAV